MKALKFDSVSEVNILIEVLKHYKHCQNKNDIILPNNIDKMLDVLLEVQKLFMGEK
tara:strand:- start:1604 stop:1771 length:168 start_codon:yes stop_codon:yes gene_type:complete